MSAKKENLMEKIVSLSKRRGIIFPGSEIYGGLANTWDYGPVGVELKNNVKKIWWKYFVQEREDIVGLDAAILMNPKTWEASGHVAGFSDPLVDCKKCKTRHRGDKLLEEKFGVDKIAGIKLEDVQPRLIKEKIKCPDCGAVDWTEAKRFNLMFKTHQGVTEDSGSLVYLRPETAQGIFVNFKNVLDTTHMKLPFGIAQIGKAFRNEITPGNFTFRTREFEQMEIEYFVAEKDWKKKYEEFKEACWKFFTGYGLNPKKLRWRQHASDELSHYSKETYDIEYQFPWGWGELEGFAYRTDFDLAQHEKFSGQKLRYREPETGKEFVPHCIEPSFGLDRTALTFLLDAYTEEEVRGASGEKETRVVLKFHKDIAPIKVAILPLSKKEELTKPARDIFNSLKSHWMVQYDETQSIGKRYRRQDEIGTPFCVTVDFETLDDKAVTVRDRDTMKQERVSVDKLNKYLKDKLEAC
ncbi:MAG: glycine--tRNA ligase [Candidatus Moranbacteria bacterium RIFOXYB1_FULL_43_19]|nr:MAG: glycine--tRNA ligase [Candidatus Moranbacteria bacterium RIFOXYA1_FULL_44_7]OGI26755.1 MAG: glycine--tRNA ligase [Candidatus Moranbacteria bacterium RIFOXYB1_FULL_43_19]OGI32482.1 MAG: glycine--tRNA ligase [Candidatus Moranbacteria bacterium RIFOXYC1_FULL_44_13]OGI37639.1 MAG: glycine--tRNA ligase [Candidatus Moranbacteria bacterium RIFOXYD1_FULL_44_12]